MSADQINELRDTFRVAMMDWDVPVSVKIIDDMAKVSFELWRTQFQGSFYVVGEQWQTADDCPHSITNGESVWQWISMQLYDKLTA